VAIKAPANDAEATENQSDVAYDSDPPRSSDGEGAGTKDEKHPNNDSALSLEETKTYEDFKSKITEQPFYGSDEEAYIEDEDDGEG
jgi:hypothetical protein